MHLRQHKALRDPIVKPEHMPQEHQKYLNYNEQEFLAWGASVGEHAEKLVRHFLTNGKETEQGYKACGSMSKLGQRYGEKRLEKACECLLEISSTPSIRTLNTILKNGQDKLIHPQKTPKPTEKQQHGITRGAAYFRKGGESK